MNKLIDIENEQIQDSLKSKSIPVFKSGDTVRVNVFVTEGNKERIQAFEGICIARSNRGFNSTFTIRKISHGEGVERVFPLYSPMLESIKLIRKGKVRRSKLYYLRQRSGKSARIAEKKDVVKKKSATRSSDHNNQIKLAKDKQTDEPIDNKNEDLPKEKVAKEVEKESK
ncbi:MAG: 50S ribosomal protein L19 [Pseudomonadota bacterium]|nr:50S ribosomal protein L19 [Pseudomonadota bacterium]